jgi:hypothetical protein
MHELSPGRIEEFDCKSLAMAIALRDKSDPAHSPTNPSDSHAAKQYVRKTFHGVVHVEAHIVASTARMQAAAPLLRSILCGIPLLAKTRMR